MLSRIIGRPDLAVPGGDVAPDGTLMAVMPSGQLVGSGAVHPASSFTTAPDAGVTVVEPNRPSYTDAQDAIMLAPVVGQGRDVQAGAQHFYAVEYTDAPELTGEHGVIAGRPALVTWEDAKVEPFPAAPPTVWREPPREERPDLCEGRRWAP